VVRNGKKTKYNPGVRESKTKNVVNIVEMNIEKLLTKELGPYKMNSDGLLAGLGSGLKVKNPVKKSFWIRKIDKSISTEAEVIISSSEKKFIDKITMGREKAYSKFNSIGVQNDGVVDGGVSILIDDDMQQQVREFNTKTNAAEETVRYRPLIYRLIENH
jgi:hypothetical protein